MDAIVLAGGKSQEDALSELTGGELKSTLPIAGKPMVQWVLDALSESQSIDQVVVMGIEDTASLTCTKPIHFLPDEGSLIGNMQKASMKLDEIHPHETHAVSISADIPAITAAIIDHLVGIYQKAEVDICYGVVERRVMEERYPNSKRTYIKVKKDEICGGDLNCFSKRAVLKPDALWQELIKLRKNPLKQAAMIGIDTLLLLVLGLIDIDQVAERVCRRMGITGKVIKVPFAEVGMDVDKPFQFKIVEADLMR